MIYCKLKGGLANMMFQIAATYSFSLDLETECSFPNLEGMIQYLNNDRTYNPSLTHAEEYYKIFRNLKQELPKNEDFFVDGYFQSEKYFSRHREQILKLFEIPTDVKDIIEQKYSEILNKLKTTSIHVRRGDYLSFPNHHPTQDLEYFNESIKHLDSETDLFIFCSDDINWCKENFKGDKFYFVENEKDYIELYLMSLCNNNITSNSSFSWWGAWLNQNENKKVIGTKKWFGNAINHFTGDILPEEWIKL